MLFIEIGGAFVHFGSGKAEGRMQSNKIFVQILKPNIHSHSLTHTLTHTNTNTVMSNFSSDTLWLYIFSSLSISSLLYLLFSSIFFFSFSLSFSPHSIFCWATAKYFLCHLSLNKCIYVETHRIHTYTLSCSHFTISLAVRLLS